MTDFVFILLGLVVGMPAGHLITVWAEERAFRRRSRLVLPGDRIVRRVR